MVWLFNLWFLFIYQLSFQSLAPLTTLFQFLGASKIYPTLIFGLLVLRMISFSTDFHWSFKDKNDKIGSLEDELKDRMKKSLKYG